MILSIIGIIIVSLGIIIGCHSVWNYFYGLWIQPHLYDSSPLFVSHKLSHSTSEYNSDLIPVPEITTTSITEIPSELVELNDQHFSVGSSSIDELTGTQNSNTYYSSEMPMNSQMNNSTNINSTNINSNDIEYSKQSLKSLFTSLKQQNHQIPSNNFH